MTKEKYQNHQNKTDNLHDNSNIIIKVTVII